MTDKTDSKEREALIEEFGFVVEEQFGVWTLVEDVGCTRPANIYERVLWKEMLANRASLTPSGFDAADMATASAQGFRDGVASLAANAGREPVAWQYRSVRDKGLWFDCTEERAKQRAAHPETWDVRYLYTHPSPPEGMVGGWSKGVEAAAALLSKKADDFARENGYDDMGSLSFGRGSHADAKLDYHSSLIELAEEVRAMLNTPPASEAKGE